MKAFVEIPDIGTARILLGPNDAHAKILRQKLNVRITLREDRLVVEGEPANVHTALPALERMVSAIDPSDRKGYLPDELQWLLSGAGDNPDGTPDSILVMGGARIEPKSEGQKNYINLIRTRDVVFGVGPAGTGKTYLAVACAVEALRAGKVRRLVLARPAVEAGEKLGFLPGDLREKVNPYLRPLYDSLEDMLPRGEMQQYIEAGIIEVAPLAFMRGRTLNRAFIILDEAQNTTPGQMKMFLTRLGAQSQAVVTGDDTQIDLEDPAESGLLHAREVLGKVEGVGFARLDKSDVVRHRLVRDIIDAYEAEGARP